MESKTEFKSETTTANSKTEYKTVAKVVNAGKEYKAGDTVITALKASTVELKAGELLLIIGPSGSGKTTLLSLFGCVIYPSFGEVWIDNVKVNDLNESKLAELRLLKIGFIFQRFNLIAPLTALENVMMPLLLQGIGDKEAKLKATAALAKVGMGDRMKNLSNDLSGGQQQRVAIARALINDPMLIMADEPTGNLDSANTKIVFDIFRHISSNHGTSIIAVSHDEDFAHNSDRVIQMVDGKVVTD